MVKQLLVILHWLRAEIKHASAGSCRSTWRRAFVTAMATSVWRREGAQLGSCSENTCWCDRQGMRNGTSLVVSFKGTQSLLSTSKKGRRRSQEANGPSLLPESIREPMMQCVMHHARSTSSRSTSSSKGKARHACAMAGHKCKSLQTYGFEKGGGVAGHARCILQGSLSHQLPERGPKCAILVFGWIWASQRLPLRPSSTFS